MNTILEFKNITYSYNNNTVILDKVAPAVTVMRLNPKNILSKHS